MINETKINPWAALAALCIGFFMVTVDVTIVAVANPVVMHDLHTGISSVMWVTSAYGLTYSVPLLATGRLGDRFSPKNIYLAGLAVFTVASLWCGLSTSIGMLIAARTVQGFGAALLMPQTMAIITRIFPPDKRGAALGAWGAAAGLAALTGPIAGGILVDWLGWKWIFLINLPIGGIALLLAALFVPRLETQEHRFDFPGVALSAIGMFLLVFGIQEGDAYHWSSVVWSIVVAGLVVLAVFLYHQSRNTGEPLVPLDLFRTRNFGLSNIAVSAISAALTALILCAFFYLELGRGLSPTKSALIFSPLALVTGFLAPTVGRLVDRLHPRYIPSFGFALITFGLIWLIAIMPGQHALWELTLPIALMGVGSSCIWTSVAAIATHDLPVQRAGAGSGIYNTTRLVASVLGSAAISALITARMAADALPAHLREDAAAGGLPAAVQDSLRTALAQSMLLPLGLLLIGLLASVLLVEHKRNDAAGIADNAADDAARSLEDLTANL